MRRILRPGLFVTVSVTAGVTTAACANPFSQEEAVENTHNPPAPLRPIVATFPTGPVTARQVLNPRGPDGQRIYRGAGDECYVELPFPEPPTSVRPAPRESVACPDPLLLDEAWSGCVGGTLQVDTVEPLACVCNFFGNPPPPPQASVCPREVAGRLNAPTTP
ncbi:MAG: hypothetical protein V4850_21615 [Myxococcota bacterium]